MRVSPDLLSRRGEMITPVFEKEIYVAKDINGIALDEENTAYLALGMGTLGGLARLNLSSGDIDVFQNGTPFRQIVYQPTSDTLYTTSKDYVQLYSPSNLQQPTLFNSPGTNTWGLALPGDGSDGVIYGSPKDKTIYRLSINGAGTKIIRKSKENKLKSVWSLACGRDQIYVSDRKKRQVVCFNANTGAYEWRQKLGRPFSKSKKIIEDMDTGYMGGMCTDGSGDIYVCDTQNDSLVRLNRQGALVANYDHLDIHNPTLVTMDKDYIVVVTDQTLLSCKVKVFKKGERSTQL